MEKMTGINQKQLSNYLNHRAIPRKKQIERIRNGIHRFAVSFRLGIYRLCTVHTSGADPDQDTVIVLQQCPQADLAEKPVLGRYVTAGENNQAGVFDQFRCLGCISSVQNPEPAEQKAGIFKDSFCFVCKEIRFVVKIRI